ncbi:MAG TPA: hypothetical protein VN682_09765 [Terriglobales bacterium]|nr:hypothetical protein [Terriglobales bacterium]
MTMLHFSENDLNFGHLAARSWQLVAGSFAQHWYANRLTLEAHKPKPEEIRHIFADIGLEDPFWDPKADMFA